MFCTGLYSTDRDTRIHGQGGRSRPDLVVALTILEMQTYVCHHHPMARGNSTSAIGAEPTEKVCSRYITNVLTRIHCQE